MYTETKLHLIEEVLKTDDEAILAALETVLDKSGKLKKTKRFSAHELVGGRSKKDTKLIEKVIENNTNSSLPIVFAKKPNISALAGIWKSKDISLEDIRKNAWGHRI